MRLWYLLAYAALWAGCQLLPRILFRRREPMAPCSARTAAPEGVRLYKRYACAAMASASAVVGGVIVARFAGWLTSAIAVHGLGLALGFLSLAGGLAGWRRGLHPLPSGYGTSYVLEPNRTWRAWLLLAGGLGAVVFPATMLVVEIATAA